MSIIRHIDHSNVHFRGTPTFPEIMNHPKAVKTMRHDHRVAAGYDTVAVTSAVPAFDNGHMVGSLNRAVYARHTLHASTDLKLYSVMVWSNS